MTPGACSNIAKYKKHDLDILTPGEACSNIAKSK